ncbi:lipoprotein insertase outer membrane protein LolB [Aquabacterium sp. J223]|uniref:lipoprotein insertase outer membrane protein LolB n=1 Tax=Aquabacterium sp. J223 TaxID=2898431 RepID=UPI0021ADACE8|nr:lipoprotein insertase outer membrane protein LolB [Aquabacterium sp. J223]UUX96582.1 outer membrane lipoprotein LolB [Aquabacterium sp. J223]
MNLARRPLLALAGVLLLAGCTSVPRQQDGAPVEPLNGRLSLAVDATGEQPAQRMSAAFELQGDARNGTLRLATPLGNVLAEAQWTERRAVLRDGSGERQFESLAALAQALLGEPLPLQALVDWLRGMPWPGAASRPVDGGFEQLEWRVDTQGLSEGRLDARRERPPAVQLRVRLDRSS